MRALYLRYLHWRADRLHERITRLEGAAWWTFYPSRRTIRGDGARRILAATRERQAGDGLE